jgi:hypothetical protein
MAAFQGDAGILGPVSSSFCSWFVLDAEAIELLDSTGVAKLEELHYF